MKRIYLAASLFALLATVAGCGVHEETIKVAQPDPMTQVKSTLQNYVNGQPVTRDRKSTRLNSSHIPLSRMPSSA